MCWWGLGRDNEAEHQEGHQVWFKEVMQTGVIAMQMDIVCGYFSCGVEVGSESY